MILKIDVGEFGVIMALIIAIIAIGLILYYFFTTESEVNKHIKNYDVYDEKLTNELKVELKKIVKEKNSHLEKYGYIYVRVYSNDFQKNKYFISVWIGYHGMPSNDIDGSNSQTHFRFKEVGESYEGLKHRLISKLKENRIKI